MPSAIDSGITNLETYISNLGDTISTTFSDYTAKIGDAISAWFSDTTKNLNEKLDAIKNFFTVDNLKQVFSDAIDSAIDFIKNPGNTLKKLAVIYGVPQKSFQVRLQMPLFRAPLWPGLHQS